MRMGTVTNVSPLEVRFDGDTVDTPIAAVSDGLSFTLLDRVAVELDTAPFVAHIVVPS